MEIKIDSNRDGKYSGPAMAIARKSVMINNSQRNGCILYLTATKSVFNMLNNNIEIPVDKAAPSTSNRPIKK